MIPYSLYISERIWKKNEKLVLFLQLKPDEHYVYLHIVLNPYITYIYSPALSSFYLTLGRIVVLSRLLIKFTIFL